MKTKKGIYFKDAKNIVKASNQNSNWSLVIGAGTSNPIFPSWPDLIRSVYLDIYAATTTTEIDNIIAALPLDSILQSLKNHSVLSDEDFNLKLSEALYRSFWNKLNITDRNVVFKVLSIPIPGQGSNNIWEGFFRVMKDDYEYTTFYQLAKTLFSGYLKGVRPESVISFNAESLLHTTLTSLMREYYGRKRNPVDKMKQRLDIITRSISSSNSDRIPFYHIHGYLPVPFITNKRKISRGATDKLVFSESEYLNLANSTFSWQSSVFLHSAYTNVLIFVGLSFSDLNLRKWLSWTNSNRLKEINQFNFDRDSGKGPTKHFWIRPRPSNVIEESLIENNVSHLGVRLIWIDDYSQVGEALAMIVGID